jgi:hypothetical protein
MIVVEAGAEHIRHVCQNLRPHCRAELLATRWHDEPAKIAVEILALKAIRLACFAFLTDDDATPAAIAGAWLTGPRTAGVLVASTPQWLTVAPAVYRFIAKQAIPFVLMPNVAVAETAVMVSEQDDRRWLGRLGFHDVGAPLPRGKHGELFVHVAWVNPVPPELLPCVNFSKTCSVADRPERPKH